MKNKVDKKIIVIIVLSIILIGIIVAYINKNSSSITETTMDVTESAMDWSQTDVAEEESTSTGTTISKTGEIYSALEENLELHATYYFEKAYVSQNEYVEKGETLIEYTNGTYLVAPYDCVVTALNVPDEGEQCTNQHYITVEAVNTVSMTLTVSETLVDSVTIGQEASLYITTLGKTYTGYVTNISTTASNGNFTVTAEFVNDGDIKIGMTGKCSITVI